MRWCRCCRSFVNSTCSSTVAIWWNRISHPGTGDRGTDGKPSKVHVLALPPVTLSAFTVSLSRIA
jgi:hypothetical protein